MKIATFTLAGERRVGIANLEREEISPFDLTVDEARCGLLAIIDRNGALPPTLSPVAFSQVEIEAPIPLPRRNIFCVGKNYFEHAHEFARSGFDSSAAAGAVPKEPIIFSKLPETVVANHARVIIDPSVSTAIDYEAELAVIIGRPARHLTDANALDCVAGYSCFNDATLRDYQRRTPQWTIGKNFDGTGAFGPWFVPASDLPPGAAGLKIESRLNGQVMQSDNTKNMLFPVIETLRLITEAITLEPGDLIIMGTPAGVGYARKPPVWMKPGDRIEIEIEGVGVLANPVIDEV